MKQEWQALRLGDACSFLNRGGAPTYVEKGGIAVLNQRCIRDHRVDFSVARRHDTKAKAVSSERLVRAGDVLVNSTGQGTLGRVAQLREDPPEPTTVDSHITIVRPSSALFFQDFFGYALRYIEEELTKSGEGCGGQTELNRTVLAERFQVRFPKSLPEQQRIVALLDEAFAGIAIAKANAERNLQNARALFESHLRAVFTRRGKGWTTVPIGEVSEIFDGPHATPRTVASGPVFLGIAALQDGKINLRETRHVTFDDFKRWTRRVTPQADDVVFSYETRLGQAAMVPPNLECCLGRRMALVRGNRNRLDPRFFVYQYISPPFREYLASKTVRGATVDRISLKEFPSFPVALPGLEEQRRLAASMESLREQTERLGSLCERKVAALEALKKSLLNRAFNGDL